jgi:DNA-binding response OmpR family regulator
MKPLRVYLVEDDEDLREEMVLLLSRAGLEVQGVPDAPAFYKAHALAPCEVAVLDIALNGEDGLSIASNLRATGPIGIVMASARGAVHDRVEALQEGADAYMVKPIHIDELIATVRTLGRRVRAMMPKAAVAPFVPAPPASSLSSPRWRLAEGDWVLCDPAGRTLKLTTTERAFLACLLREDGKVVSREALFIGMAVAPHDNDPKRLDVIVSRLRRKAMQAGLRLPLHAVRGAGFQFVR